MRAARSYAGARRSLLLAEARAALQAVISAAPEGSAGAVIAAEIVRRIEDTARAVRPVVSDRVALRYMRQSTTAAALAHAFRERLAPTEVALLTAPYRELLDRGERAGG